MRLRDRIPLCQSHSVILKRAFIFENKGSFFFHIQCMIFPAKRTILFTITKWMVENNEKTAENRMDVAVDGDGGRRHPFL